MAKDKNYVVTSVSEDGYVSVYGTYSEEKASKVSSKIYEDDTDQKVHVEVVKLSKY